MLDNLDNLLTHLVFGVRGYDLFSSLQRDLLLQSNGSLQSRLTVAATEKNRKKVQAFCADLRKNEPTMAANPKTMPKIPKTKGIAIVEA